MSRCIATLLVVLFAGCRNDANDVEPRSEDEPVVTAKFVDVAKAAGVDFTCRNGEESGHFSILESLGAGIGILDFDQDGLDDVLIPGGGEFDSTPAPTGLPAALFRNRGAWRFDDVSVVARMTEPPFYSHGVAVGDYDSDGFPDVLITGYGGLALYRNLGDGTFERSDGDTIRGIKTWSTSAAWGDANRDGVLDLYVVNYVDWSFDKHPDCVVAGNREICPPVNFDPISDVLLFGNGDGTFRDESSSAGLVEGGKGLAVLAADVDLDGDLDYYVANDTTPNVLYRNDGSGRFDEVGISSGTAFGEGSESEGSMGVDLGDFDLDGLPDLWVSNYENQSFALYRNSGDCLFEHVSGVTGINSVGTVYVGFGTSFLDFDCDGDEDLFATNGHVMRHSRNAAWNQPPLLLENNDGRRFVNIAANAGTYTSADHMGRGVAVADLDRDGDVDLAVSHTNEPVSLLDNQSQRNGNWLRLRLVGRSSHRDAVGAGISIHVGDQTVTRHVTGGGSYLSASSTPQFIGCGKIGQIDVVEVVWPSGLRTRFENVTTDATYVVREGFVDLLRDDVQ